MWLPGVAPAAGGLGSGWFLLVGVRKPRDSSVMSFSSSMMVEPVVSGRWTGEGEWPRGVPGNLSASFFASSMARCRFCWFLNDVRLLQRPI